MKTGITIGLLIVAITPALYAQDRVPAQTPTRNPLAEPTQVEVGLTRADVGSVRAFVADGVAAERGWLRRRPFNYVSVGPTLK